MKNLPKFIIILILISPALLLFSQTADSMTLDSARTLQLINETQKINKYDEGLDGAPGLLIFAILAFAFIFVTVGIGIVLTILILLLIFGLIVSGILSASILVGLNKKSFSQGFKTFVVSSSTVGGLLLGVFGFWILNKITHWWSLPTSLTIGLVSGIIAGILLGFFLFFVVQKLTTFLNTKLEMNKLENENGSS